MDKLAPNEKLPWHNDHPLQPARVAEILAADLIDLVPLRVAVLGEGWDFVTFVVNDDWVFRFPKRRQAVRQLAREASVLDTLAPRLADQPISIPHYRYHVRQPALAPLPYGGYPLLRGEALIECPADCVDRDDIGHQLGAFLGRLDTAAPLPPPRVFHDSFASNLVDFRRELDATIKALPTEIARACIDLLARTPPLDAGPPRFQHGDLGAEHILIDRARGRITAIIDWGDAGWGNSVGDLVGLWAWGGDRAVAAALPPSGLALSREHWIRLRMWGAAAAMGTAYYGYTDAREALLATAIGWLERMQRAGQLADPATPDADPTNV